MHKHILERICLALLQSYLPDVEGDYFGIEGLKRFFDIIARKTFGTFKVDPISATPVGEELIVVQSRNSMALDQRKDLRTCRRCMAHRKQ